MSYSTLVEAAVREAVQITMTDDGITISVEGVDDEIEMTADVLHSFLANKDRRMA